MGNNRTYIRDCVCNCTCHGNITIQDEDESIIDAWSLSSTVTMDNQPGAGRGLDQLFQFLGLRLERHMAVVLDRLGHGPAAVERRALKIIEKLHGEFRYVKQWSRKSVLKITTSSEIMQLQRELDNCCKLLVGHLRSSAPTTQHFALDALWKLRCANPLRVDDAFRALGLDDIVKSIHDSLNVMKRHLSEAETLWKREYVRPYDDVLLDSLLASSRKALIAASDNELHSAAMSLLQLKGGFEIWIPPRYAHVVPQLRTLSKFILDPELAFMAVGYVERVGLGRETDCADEDLSIVSASIMENLRTVCSFHANLLNAEGRALPDAYWRVMEYVNQIDVFKSFFPPEEQQESSEKREANRRAYSPGAVDWKHLEQATRRAWQWLLRELTDIAYDEGRRFFLKTRHERARRGELRQAWERVEFEVACDWFEGLIVDTFREHDKCADCVNQIHCEYWWEAYHCFMKGDHDYDEIVQEFWKDCDESSRSHALAQMKEWREHTMFSHEHGKRVRWLRTGSV